MARIFKVGSNQKKGGIETYIDNLCGALNEHEVVYCRPEMNIDGIVWHRPQNRHHYYQYRTFWKRFFRDNYFDVLYYNTCDIVSIDMLRFAKKAGVPVRIIHSHNSGIQQAINKKLSIFHRLSEYHNRKVLDLYATHLFACSEIAGKWMFGGRKYTIIKNGIDILKYAYCQQNREKLREVLGLRKELLVGIIGRISSQKNPSFAIKILSELITKNPSVQAVFLGDGELRMETENEIHKIDKQNNIHFLGNVDNVNEWLSAIDVLLMPSLFEGLPFVLVEAQASGLPCVVSSAVTKEADLTGLIQFADLNDTPEEWAERILQIDVLHRPDTSRQMTEAGYSIEHTARTVEKILSDSLKNYHANFSTCAVEKARPH